MIFKHLKKLLLLCAIASNAHAAEVTLDWLPSDDDVSGYYVYYGTVSGNYSVKVDAGEDTQITISNLQACQNYYFVVTAYDDAGDESAPSNEANYVTPGMVMENFTAECATLKFTLIAGHAYEIQASTDLQNWMTVGSVPAFSEDVIGEVFDYGAIDYPARFYRTVQY